MRVLRAVLLVAAVVAGTILVQRAVRKDLVPAPPVWSRPLEGPWDGSPGAPSLHDACLRLLREAAAGDAGALGRLDARLNALARDREGDHPLARVDAWRALMREVRSVESLPEPGIHPVDWRSDLPGRGSVRYAVLVPGPVHPPAAVVLSLPAPGQDPAEHLRICWGGRGEGLIVLAPERPRGGVVHPGLLLLPLRHARDRWPVDDDRILVAGLAGEEESAARLAASFTDRFAGLVLGAGEVGDFPLRRNLDPLPTLRIPDGEAPLASTARWLERRDGGRPLRRDPYPRRIDWLIGPRRTEDRAWWLLVSRLEPDSEAARLRAEILPENRIRLRTEGVARLRVLLNDRLVDLDRPVVIEVNDAIVSRVPTRSVRRLVDAVEALGDRSAVYPEHVDVVVD